ncbi:MAG: DUF3006 domain-containing protein [Christensenellales bacterium]|jgi:hypothetical protein
MHPVVDRFENGLAVIIEGEQRFTLELSSLPDGIREGDCLKFENGVWQKDEQATLLLRQKAETLANKLFKRRRDRHNPPQ